MQLAWHWPETLSDHQALRVLHQYTLQKNLPAANHAFGRNFELCWKYSLHEWLLPVVPRKEIPSSSSLSSHLEWTQVVNMMLHRVDSSSCKKKKNQLSLISVITCSRLSSLIWSIWRLTLLSQSDTLSNFIAWDSPQTSFTVSNHQLCVWAMWRATGYDASDALELICAKLSLKSTLPTFKTCFTHEKLSVFEFSMKLLRIICQLTRLHTLWTEQLRTEDTLTGFPQTYWWGLLNQMKKILSMLVSLQPYWPWGRKRLI